MWWRCSGRIHIQITKSKHYSSVGLQSSYVLATELGLTVTFGHVQLGSGKKAGQPPITCEPGSQDLEITYR